MPSLSSEDATDFSEIGSFASGKPKRKSSLSSKSLTLGGRVRGIYRSPRRTRDDVSFPTLEISCINFFS